VSDDVRVSVIIPTIGRETLQRALDSVADADEIILVHDTDNKVRVATYSAGENCVDVVLSAMQGGDHGYPARMIGMRYASGTHLAFLDDDDVYLPGAIDAMRERACDVPVIFRMRHPEHGVLWRTPVLQFANVGTPMFLVPNVPARLGAWAAHAPALPEPGGDYTFISGCVERMGQPEWDERVVAEVRPHELATVSVVTPWRDHPELSEDYWEAIRAGRPDEVIIVDNASDPPVSMPTWVTSYEDRVQILRCGENEGFARASNLGLHAARSDAVLFLNNDIVCGRDDWLYNLKSQLEPGVIVSARIRWDKHGDVDGRPYPYAEGWCLLAMRDELLALGGFDDRLQEPAYYSDNILSFRARMAGMTLREVKIGLRHLVGATAGGPESPEKRAAIDHNFEIYRATVREVMVPA